MKRLAEEHRQRGLAVDKAFAYIQANPAFNTYNEMKIADFCLACMQDKRRGPGRNEVKFWLERRGTHESVRRFWDGFNKLT